MLQSILNQLLFARVARFRRRSKKAQQITSLLSCFEPTFGWCGCKMSFKLILSRL